MEKEILNGKYSVSDKGQVFSLDYRKTGKKVELKKTVKDKYPYIKIAGKKHLVKKIVANAFIENPENKECVYNINGNKEDNRVENLEWLTKKEVTEKSIVGLSKMTYEKANKIRLDFHETNLTYREVADYCGISKRMAERILKREAWV